MDSAAGGDPLKLVAYNGVYPVVDPTAFIAEGAFVVGSVTVGGNASVWYNCVIRGDINTIRIGERTNIQDGAVLHVTHEYSVQIGTDVTVGHRAIIHGATIEHGSLIGMGAIILDDAHVGPCALVAAGALVREHFVVPEGTLAAGVPARIVRSLTDDERRSLVQSAHNYVSYAEHSKP